MNEGWFGDDHFILFTPEESAEASAKYAIEKLLPGFTVMGLRGWDDFLVKNVEGHTFTVPTVPVDPKYIEPIAFGGRSTRTLGAPELTPCLSRRAQFVLCSASLRCLLSSRSVFMRPTGCVKVLSTGRLRLTWSCCLCSLQREPLILREVACAWPLAWSPSYSLCPAPSC